MQRVIIAAVVIAVALLVAWLAQRRKPAPPVRTGDQVPDQLDRDDFDLPEAEWLVAVFTDATCKSCAKAVSVASALESKVVAVQTVERQSKRELHDRYAIDSVPTTCVVDREGVVKAAFLGPPKAADLWAAVAELRG